jgi:hypothetical protein
MKNEETKKVEEVKPPVGIIISCEDNNQDAAFRIFDKVKEGEKEFPKEIFYASTRIGGLKQVEGGYAAAIPADDFEKYAGKKYTLVTLGKKRIVLDGEIKSLSKDKRTNGSK